MLSDTITDAEKYLSERTLTVSHIPLAVDDIHTYLVKDVLPQGEEGVTQLYIYNDKRTAILLMATQADAARLFDVLKDKPIRVERGCEMRLLSDKPSGVHKQCKKLMRRPSFDIVSCNEANTTHAEYIAHVQSLVTKYQRGQDVWCVLLAVIIALATLAAFR